MTAEPSRKLILCPVVFLRARSAPPRPDVRVTQRGGAPLLRPLPPYAQLPHPSYLPLHCNAPQCVVLLCRSLLCVCVFSRRFLCGFSCPRSETMSVTVPASQPPPGVAAPSCLRPICSTVCFSRSYWWVWLAPSDLWGRGTAVRCGGECA